MARTESFASFDPPNVYIYLSRVRAAEVPRLSSSAWHSATVDADITNLV